MSVMDLFKSLTLSMSKSNIDAYSTLGNFMVSQKVWIPNHKRNVQSYSQTYLMS